jgi:hypothetical protein
MFNYSNFETKKNQTLAKTRDQLNYRATGVLQDVFRALYNFIKQMLAAVLGK